MEENTVLDRLLRDFQRKSVDEMHSPIFAERVLNEKIPERADSMCREMEEIYNNGRIEGRAEAAKKIAFNLAVRGMKEADIADILTVNAALVKEWLSGCPSFPSTP